MASKHSNLNFIDAELEYLKQSNLYRKLKYATANGSQITINNKKLLNLCSNDYLGMPPTKMQSRQLQSSSRLVSGNDESYKKLEDALAKHKSQQSSLIYPTGYMANLGTISAIAKKGDLILSDELNHASIVEACKLTDADILVYKHNNMNDLEQKIKKQKGKNKFVITEGIFSMDGDLADLEQILEISTKSDAVTIVDDAHGDFVIGEDGKGTPDHLRVAKEIDLYTSSLSKGLGSFGGYVASQGNVIDFCINRSKSFIYTSALPSFLVDYSLKRFRADRERHRRKLKKNTEQMIKGLVQLGFEIKTTSQIIPIMVGDEKKAMDFGEFLFKNAVFAQPIRYPTVPMSKARLRISVTAWLSGTDIEILLGTFEKAQKRFCG